MKAIQFSLLCLGLFALVVLTTLGLSQITTSAGSSAPTLVSHFEGEGNFQSSEFAVTSGWEIRWEHEGKIKQIEWSSPTAEGDLVMSLPHKPIREHGGVNLSSSGTFQLEVIAEGPWEIDVWQYP